MQGRRVDGKPSTELLDGEYKLTENGNVWARTPNGHLCHVAPHIWSITEGSDGAITVSPSIKLCGTLDGKEVVLFHGYLTNGVWSACPDSPAAHAEAQ